MSGHSDFGIFNNFGTPSIFTWVQADNASAACFAYPDNLDTMSMTFVAVLCDADDPCSVNSAYDPKSSFPISPRNESRPFVLLVFCLKLGHSSNERCPSMMQT